MPAIYTYQVTQTKTVQVRAVNPSAAIEAATLAFEGEASVSGYNRPQVTDTPHITDMSAKEIG